MTGTSVMKELNNFYKKIERSTNVTEKNVDLLKPNLIQAGRAAELVL